LGRRGLIRRATPVALACSLAALAGCGNARTPVPGISQPVAPQSFHTVRYARSAGVTVKVPDNWASTRSQAPLLGTVSSGSAVIALWRYPRTDPLPSDPATLAAARTALIGAARSHDPGLQLIRSAVTRAAGAPAIELDAVEQISGQIRRVRSLHVYEAGVELVLEEYAPPGIFHAVDHSVFSPVRRSLTLVRAPAA
jgi:hypothetical protein